MPTTMQYGEEWEQRAEVNMAFVAQTRSYADLIFLRHLPASPGVPLDFARLWGPVDGPDVSDTEGDAQSAAAPAHRLPSCQFGCPLKRLGVPVPSAASVQDLRCSSESREDLRSAVKRAYHRRAKHEHPDKKGGTQEATQRFKEVNEANEAVVRWLDEMSGQR